MPTDRPDAAATADAPPAPEQEAAAPPPARLREPLLLCAIAAAETLALAILLWGTDPSALELAAVHGVTLAAIGLVLLVGRRQRRDTKLPLLGLIGGTAMGPAGPLGAGLVGLAALGPRQSSPLIDDWYRRISLSTAVDDDTRLCEDVRVGRTPDLGRAGPRAFPTLMETGPLGARQFVLGLIARRFHPAYLGTLDIALRSDEPSIRVQAAAVATHVGADLRQRYAELMAKAAAAGTDPVAALGLIREIEAFERSSLIDEARRKEAADLAARLGEQVITRLAAGRLRLPYAADPAGAAELEETLETLLIARGRFMDLRAHRGHRRIRQRHPTSRLKRLAAGEPARRATP